MRRRNLVSNPKARSLSGAVGARLISAVPNTCGTGGALSQLTDNKGIHAEIQRSIASLAQD